MILSLAALACLSGGSVGKNAAAEQAEKDYWKTGQFLGVESCKECHLSAGKPTQFVLLTEYTTWRTLDKHSQAYAVLEDVRSQRMGDLLGEKGHPVQVTDPKTGCLNCHAMNFPMERWGENFSPKDGVSCDGCHGPSEGWLTDHAFQTNKWRRTSPAEKFKRGMRDVRNPVAKAQMCMSCHVGDASEGKVVTHAMFAAGHPPLPPFDLETFCKNLPQHWRDSRDVPFLKDLPKEDKLRGLYDMDSADFVKTRATVVGSFVALHRAAALVADRADVQAPGNVTHRWSELALPAYKDSKAPLAIWPEVAMAHSDCYACHHELKSPSWRQERGYDLILADGQRVHGIPGRVQVRRWPLALGDLGLRLLAPVAKDLAADYARDLSALNQACNEQPFGKPETLHKTAAELRDWSAKLLGPPRHDKVPGALPTLLDQVRSDRGMALELLRRLCSLPVGKNADFEIARQIASAFQDIYTEWDPDGSQATAIPPILQQLNEDLNLQPYTGRTARLDFLRKKLEKGGDKLPPTKELQRLLERTSSKEYREVLKGEELRTFEQFLNSLQRLTNKDFTDSLLTDEAKAELDRIGNEEMQRTLEKMSAYSPQRFHDKLAQLAGLLPIKKD
jgi:hypothetical protein